MSDTVTAAVAAPTETATGPIAEALAVVTDAETTLTVMQRISAVFAKLDATIKHDEAAIVAFLKAHL